MIDSLWRWCVTLALMPACAALADNAVSAAPQRVAPTAAPAGHLVIIGGALRADNAAVWSRIVALAGGPGARVAVFASAAAEPVRAGESSAQQLRAYGADAFVVPIALRLAGTDAAAAADDPALAAAVRSAGGAYFAGGDQDRITRVLRHADGSNTRVLDALWQLYRQGGVIAGSSAGAAIMSATMFDRPPDGVLATLKQGMAGQVLAPGLGFIGDDVFVDQHLLVRGRFARMLPAMLARGYRRGVGIDENSAVVVGPQRDVDVIGYRGAIVVDLADARSSAGAFNVRDARISYLDHGDRYNLASGAFTPGPDKAGGRIDAGAADLHGPQFSADILGNGSIVDLMARLIDSDQDDAIGLALDSPRGADGAQGFEFRLRRAADSVGYQSATSSSVSVYQLRLDVTPVALQPPWYRQLPSTGQP